MKPPFVSLLATFDTETLAASEQLWPDPFSAPDVPPRRVLAACLSNPALLEPWLHDQIRGSVHCQRALDVLRAEAMYAGSDLGGDLEDVQSSGCEQGVSQAWQSGRVFVTRSVVRHIVGGRLTLRQTGQPMKVLLMSGPGEEDGIRFWTGLLCTPEEDWPESVHLPENSSVVEVDNGHRLIAHRGYEVAVAEGQLEHSFGALTAESDACLKQWTDEGPLPLAPLKATQLSLEQARLTEQVAWLTMAYEAERIAAISHRPPAESHHLLSILWDRLKAAARSLASFPEEPIYAGAHLGSVSADSECLRLIPLETWPDIPAELPWAGTSLRILPYRVIDADQVVYMAAIETQAGIDDATATGELRVVICSRNGLYAEAMLTADYPSAPFSAPLPSDLLALEILCYAIHE